MLIITSTGGEDFESASTGVVNAVCSNVYDIGMHEQEYQGNKKTVHQIIIMWEINETIKKGDFAGKRFVLTKRYTANLMNKSNLYKDLVAWRGIDFTEEEAKGFDLEKVIGANCLLNIGLSKNGKPKITSIMRLPKDKYEIMKPELPKDHIPKWIEAERIKGFQQTNPYKDSMNIDDKPDMKFIDSDEDSSIPF